MLKLRPHLETWHRNAPPYIRTRAFAETWRDFTHAWRNVGRADGSSIGMIAKWQSRTHSLSGSVTCIWIRSRDSSVRLLASTLTGRISL